jgi:ribosomal-protein-alanine N-acetyltransferase
MAALDLRYVVHRMTLADVPAVATVDRISFSVPSAAAELVPSPEQRFCEELKRSWSHGWVVRDEGEKAIAFLLAWVVADEMQILTLATHPAVRRRGIAGSLVAVAITFAMSSQLSQVLLEVRSSNHAAIQLYRAAGFFARSVRRRYYPDDEDAVEMVALLDPRTGQLLSRPDEVGADA